MSKVEMQMITGKGCDLVKINVGDICIFFRADDTIEVLSGYAPEQSIAGKALWSAACVAVLFNGSPSSSAMLDRLVEMVKQDPKNNPYAGRA